MSQNPVKLSITGKISYEDEITIAQAAKIITFLNADEGNGASLTGDSAEVPGDLGGSDPKNRGNAIASAREALDISGAKTNPEKIVALGQYVMQDGGDTFKVEDVKTRFRRARETPPANFTRDLGVAVREGWLAEGDDGEYYVTNKIDGIFDGGFKFPKSASGGGRTRSAAKTAKEKPEVFSTIDEFPTRMDGVASYAKMKSEGNRVLWALQFAKNRGIRGLSNKDIAWLTDHLGAGVPSGNIAGAVRGPRSSGYLNPSTTDKTVRITEDGEAYLKTVGAES
ncbi:hypothetical protein LWF01_04030 [Saxibacter everestensis]|uniref:Uncharacterized protein n=1 Tax=Saxibacter everestensis TaxID=2909229 RepID=A0ABY8QV93_9MICO|nr:hypothetical protein LWF01_04030 [Brevibacteriaceae bacterium ZFBP1038]